MKSSCYIALLRGVNVGRAKRIAMADLRKLISDLGFSGVRSLLNSGNVVFRGAAQKTAAVAAAIEEALVLKLGVASRVTVLTADELNAVLAANPLLAHATDLARMLVFVLTNPADRKLVEPLDGQDWRPEALALGKRAVYVWCPTGMIDSRPAAALGKALGDATTSRNWNTLCKLRALCEEAPT
ncbi:MAG TPA: DUF1697 domain-containing protein [Telluria sp.]|nr:DUF1697 domain-containing protein [Telluria sp.]